MAAKLARVTLSIRVPHAISGPGILLRPTGVPPPQVPWHHESPGSKFIFEHNSSPLETAEDGLPLHVLFEKGSSLQHHSSCGFPLILRLKNGSHRLVRIKHPYPQHWRGKPCNHTNAKYQ
ncbi:hypothetical protein AVEN_193844-1 [Araneus ventricosus]|uniref:Uncharacterized protein n=1 Tax=Araneus ventricosus TaxID=182803 RepID=A0A4Y2D8R9_ARAVE|nr:hypothetical protein AVEN_193844-1 [Araneus ventricosus]